VTANDMLGVGNEATAQAAALCMWPQAAADSVVPPPASKHINKQLATWLQLSPALPLLSTLLLPLIFLPIWPGECCTCCIYTQSSRLQPI
jgi:hypothetical protein